jgi:alpha-tubulin suppressor-like RCC1 family protein
LRGSDGHTFFAGEASFSSPAFFDEQVLFRNTLSADGQATFRDIVTFEDDVIHLGKISVMEAQDGGTDRGIFLWSLNSSDYGIYVASAGDGQSLSGGISAPGNDFDGLSVRFRVENGESNGFVFENSEETRLFSIRSSDGSAYFSGDVTHEGDAIHRGRIIVMDGRDGGSGRGIFLQDADTTEYGIYLATAGASRSMGDANAVPGKGFDDLSLRIRVNDNSSNGIVFENSSEDRLFSIRGNDGLAHFEGSVTHQGRTDLLDDVHFYRNNNVRIETVSAGSLHSLAIDANGHVYSWGFGAEGSLGTGSTENEVRPVSIKDEGDLFGKRVIGVAAGESHSLAVDDNGVTYSWGNGDTGALGIGTFADEEYTETRPVSISENGDLVGKTVISVSAGSEFSLALDSQGGLYSWGFGERGRLGLGSESVVFSPTMVNGFGDISSDTVIISISAGGSHALAVDENGTVYAWGDGEDGRLGTGAGTNELEPVSLANAGDLSGKKIVRVAAGHNFSLALDENGVIYSWGLGNLGRLGTGSVTSELTPVSLAASGDLAGQNIIAITAGDQHAFALDDGGSVYAWGGNANGQLGDGSTDDSSTPRNISIVSQRTITGVSAGGSHSLATDDIDGAYSWGLNGEGQLGNGEINGDDVISPRLITDSGDFLRDLARFTNEFIVQGKSVFEDRVGIGSSDPEALLHVAGEVYASNIRMAGDGSAAEPAYSWVDDSNMGMFRSDSNVLSFSTAGMERLRIDDVGHVGIGVSNIEANSALHVDGDIRIRNSDLIGACNIYTKTDVDDLIDDVDDNLAEGLYWDSETQRLGIGTVVPDAKLHVVGEAITSSLRLSSDGTAVDPAVTWVADADTGMYRVQEDALGLSTGGVERMRVAANGYVGVNSSNPSEMLYVDGNIYSTGEITSASDRRLKTNLRSLESENCLAKLRQMSGYRFNRTDWDRLGGGAQRDTDFIGFVAQDVLQVMPELVKHDDKNDRYSVNYAHMAVVLTEAIKTLAKDKEALQNDVFELRRDVAELRRNAMI